MPSVPNTNTFSLQDVVNVIPTSNNLAGLFSQANDAYFDPSYKGNKDNLLNFRNYTIPTVSFSLSPTLCAMDYTGTPCDGAKTFTVTSPGSWTLTKDATWISVNKTSGNSGDTVTISVGKALSDRSGTITITCGAETRGFRVSQSNPCLVA